jgi:DNA-directed RNA polymerase specialized sigma subunit
MYEPFYLLHDRFDQEARNWIAWQVSPVLVRSIECWCNSIHQLEPIDREFITNRVKIQAHFDRWYVEGQNQHGLDRSTIVDMIAQHLLARLRQYPEDLTIRLHWNAFLMQRCVTVGWQIWRLCPQQMRSVGLFEEIVACSYSKIANPNEVQLVLATFKSGTSQLVSGLNHLKAFIDRWIRYSTFPYLRELSGDANFGRTNLGVAARHSRGEIIKALRCSYTADRVNDEIILWQYFDIYRRETGIHVNRLVETDFEQIGQFYQQQLQHSVRLTGAEISQRLEEIGSAVRKYKLRQPLSLDASILTQGANNTAAISLGETNLLDHGDLLAAQESQEILQIVSREITSLLDEPSLSNKKPSCQQLFWLYYGLELKQQQIGEIIDLNFGLTSNPGNVSRRLRQGRNHLFQRIHAALQNEPPQLTDGDIDASMGIVLEMYFDRVIHSRLSAIFLQLNVPPHSQLSTSQQAKFVSIVATSIEQRINLCLPIDLIQANIVRIVNRFLDRS